MVRGHAVSRCLATLTLFFISTMHAQTLQWSQLAPLPDREGFAAMFAGVSHDTLMVAGGANFPGKRPWEAGTKVWYDDVWTLNHPDGTWRKAGKLPKPLGYGVSVTWKDEVICIGGSNAEGHHAAVFSLRMDGQEVAIRSYPDLPKPCANMCGELVGSTLYVAGGVEKPDAVQALHTFWSLDLADANAQWRELPSWPGKERMLATAGAAGGAFYLFSGAALHADQEGKPVREWLKDTFRYIPGKGWENLPDMPHVAVAAASPALMFQQTLLVVCGDDGSRLGFKPETQHPGFPHRAQGFDFAASKWLPLNEAPFSRATVPTVPWRGGFVLPSGEARPGYRTPEVWMVRTK